jgi:hypothetical protein
LEWLSCAWNVRDLFLKLPSRLSSLLAFPGFFFPVIITSSSLLPFSLA